MITTFTTHGIQQLTLLFRVGERMHTVVFTVPVVYGNMGKACYTTSDTELIKAMKADPKFDVFYFVKEEIMDEVIEEYATIVKGKTIEDELADPENAVRNDTVTSKQMAIAFIQGTFGEAFSQPSMSVEDMKREAARRWNVVFEKWGV